MDRGFKFSSESRADLLDVPEGYIEKIKWLAAENLKSSMQSGVMTPVKSALGWLAGY